MLGDTAIWRTDTAAEAQHALHFLCLKKNTHSCKSFILLFGVVYSTECFFHIYI